MASTNSLTTVPNVHVKESTDSVGWVDFQVNVPNNQSAVESDIADYIKTRLAQESGAGTVTAIKTSLVNTTL